LYEWQEKQKEVFAESSREEKYSLEENPLGEIKPKGKFNMKKAIVSTQQHFESSCSRTPEYLAWHRLFKREFTKFLISIGATTMVQIGKPNHFDMSGFFTVGTQIWYFRIGDLRWFKDTMLVRTAMSYADYTGGQNHYVPLDGSVEDFTEGMKYVLDCYNFDKFQQSVS